MNKPKKLIKIGPDHVEDLDEAQAHLNPNNGIDVALLFGEWLNFYFSSWGVNTWIDSEKHAFTTNELLDEFLEECKTKKE